MKDCVSSPRLFVVHAPEDVWFVEGFLLKALSLPKGEVLVSSKLEPGSVIVHEIERGALSPVTVVVVSPAFLVSPWAQFANQLAMHQSIEAANDGNATLIPAILADCALPLLSRFRVPLDFRNQDREHWDAEAENLRKKLATQAPVVAPVSCPYPGIRSFTIEDAARFHGRDKEVRDLMGRLRNGQRELYVIGPSGSGKSSLVAAGLMPSLRQSPELAGGSFLVWQMRPGADPAVTLAGMLEATAAELGDAAMQWLGDAVSRLLANHPGHDRLLIIVDQLEELFTIAESNARATFIDAVRVLRGDSRVALVLTLRADFYAQLMESALWADLDGQLARLDVSLLRGDKLRLAIEAPARALGVYFEPVLVERLLHDVADEPGALPLLQDTLLDLWHRRTRGLLRLAEYDTMSDGGQTGLAVTMARRANCALKKLSPSQREIARRVLLRLVQFGDGTAMTRRQQARKALSTVGDAPEEIDAVIRHLADYHLVTTSGGDDVAPLARVDLAHEILLSAWPTLGEWIRARKEDEQRRRVLEAKAAEWVNSGRGQSRLLDADELREVRGWLSDGTAHDLGVSEEVQSLLFNSEAALAGQVAESENRRRRWRRWVTVALLALTGAVVAVSTLAVIAGRRSQEASEQTEEARRQTRIAGEKSQELQLQLARNYVSQGREQLMSGHPAQAAPFLLAAREAGMEDKSLDVLFQWAAQGLPLVRFVHPNIVTAVAWSPDGRRVATASVNHTARVWDVVSGRPVTPPLAHQGWVMAVAWSPNGRQVATASRDHTARVWDAVSGQPVTPPLAHQDWVTAVAWSPDGRWVATASEDYTARVWDAVSGQPVTPPFTHKGWVTAVAWSPNGRRVATASVDQTARVWDVVSGQPVTPLFTHKGWVTAVAWSPDGRRVATASVDQTARVWDAVSGQPVTSPLTHQGWVTAVAWSPDGWRVATASLDKTAQVWDAVSGQTVMPSLAHQRGVTAVAWSADGWWLATASEDHSARVWDTVSGQPVTPPLAHQQVVTAVAWSPDGRQLATASDDHTARVWDVVSVRPSLTHQGWVTGVAWSSDWQRMANETARVRDAFSGQSVMRALAHTVEVAVVAWSPDSRRLATGSYDHTARVWDAGSGQAVTPPLTHQDWVTAVAWSPDGRRLATASDGIARVWDAANGQLVTPPLTHQGWVAAVAWSPDGRWLATASHDRTARVWDAASGKLVTPSLAHEGYVTAVAWSPDGRWLATASHDYTARVWDVVSGQPVSPSLAHQGNVTAMAWSPDGRQVATASWDRTARVWDASSGQPVTPPLEHHDIVTAVVWSPDGRRLATASRDYTARVWDAVSGQPVSPSLAHQGRVTAVAWSPDGRRVATASYDHTARVWDAVSGQPVTPLLAHQRGVTAVAWSPDGRWVTTTSEDWTAKVWDVSGDTSTLADWRAALERCDYLLNDQGVLVARDPRVPVSSISLRASSDPD